LGIKSFELRYGIPDMDSYSMLIRRGMPIPTSKAELFHTILDNQEEVRINVFQGESPKASENELLGEFIFSGISPGPPGKEILVQFDYDINGIVQVHVEEKDTGKAENIRVSAAHPTGLKMEEKAAAKKVLSALMDESTPVLSMREHKKSEIILKRAMAESIKLSGEERDRIETIIGRLKDALNAGKDRKRVLSLNDELMECLFFIESRGGNKS
jgi:molecular chaperone DnaK